MTKQIIRIVCFGDSLTYGYGVMDEIAYPHRLSVDLPQQFPQVQWEVFNSGINGHTTREALARLQGSVLERKPQLVFILFGSNDCALNEGQYRTPFEFEQNMRNILNAILHLSTDSPFANGTSLPILMTPPSMIDTDFYPFTTNDRLEYYGTIVKKLAAEYRLPLIDLFAAYRSITDPVAYEACFQSDGEHLSNHGYDILYPLVFDQVQQYLTKVLSSQ